MTTDNEYSPAPRRRGRPPKSAEPAHEPVRETRVEKTRRERRRRADTSEYANLKLAVPASMKEPGFTYRWVNDTAGGRVNSLYDQDWDIVSDPAIEGDGEGSPVARNVDKEKPLRAVLMRKPEEFHEEDQKAKRDRLKAMEGAMMRSPAQTKDGGSLSPAEAYVPAGYVNKTGQSAA